jgi:hypothetical protein
MRFTVAFLLLAFIAGAVYGAENTPQFFVERIDVRNTRRASPAIIRAETRLHEGQTYTEADFREASYNVARLPFVLRAEYSLEKGSRRDAYIFVITVIETKPLFFDVDIHGFFGKHTSTEEGDLVVGGRMFAGSRGVFHAAVGSLRPIGGGGGTDVRTIQAGYTQYDILGSRAFANIDVTRTFTGFNSSARPDVSVLFGVPITGIQTLSLNVGTSKEVVESYFLLGQRLRIVGTTRAASLTWSYNTTNSPFFPTRGETLDAALAQTRTTFDGLPVDPSGSSSNRLSSGSLTAAKYWELSELDSISGRVQGQLTGGHYAQSSAQAGNLTRTSRGDLESVTVDFSHSLFDEKTTRAIGDSRIDVSAAIARSANRFTPGFPGSGNSQTQRTLGASWARRTAWGLFRFGATYAW